MLTIAWVERENYEYYVKNLTDLCSGEFKKVFKNPMCVSSLFHLLKCCTLILMKQKWLFIYVLLGYLILACCVIIKYFLFDKSLFLLAFKILC